MWTLWAGFCCEMTLEIPIIEKPLHNNQLYPKCYKCNLRKYVYGIRNRTSCRNYIG